MMYERMKSERITLGGSLVRKLQTNFSIKVKVVGPMISKSIWIDSVVCADFKYVTRFYQKLTLFGKIVSELSKKLHFSYPRTLHAPFKYLDPTPNERNYTSFCSPDFSLSNSM